MTDIHKDIELELAEKVVDNFNKLVKKIDVNPLDFETINKVMSNFINSISVLKNKSKKIQYEKSKKRFNRFLVGDIDLLKNNFKQNEIFDITKFISLFDVPKNENWYLLYVISLTYISYIKKLDDNVSYNYAGMITKLIDTIKQFDSEESEKKDATDEIVDDVKNILVNTSKHELKTDDIINSAKSIASKYQSKIISGEMSMEQLMGSMFNLIKDKDKLADKFKNVDIDEKKIPNPENLIKAVSNEQIGGSNINFGNILSSLLGGTLTEKDDVINKKSIVELEKETERMMKEIDEMNKK